MTTTLDRIERLADVIGRLVDPTGDLHQRLVGATPHMSAFTMADGLTRSLAAWNRDGLLTLWRQSESSLKSAVKPAHCVVILGGVLPPSHVQAIAYPWLLGARLSVKFPSADPVCPALLCDALGDNINVIERSDVSAALQSADALVAVGDDQSVRQITSQLPVSTPVLPFGHRTSIGLVVGSAAAQSPDTAAQLATDVATFDQLGCLSPREILVVASASDARVLATAMGDQLARRDARASLPIAVEGALRGLVDEARLDGLAITGNELQWGLVLRESGDYCGTPGGRHVIVRSVPSIDAAFAGLSPIRGRLSAVSHAGVELSETHKEALVRLGASRIVTAGTIQSAPPTWPHDGYEPLRTLCRFWSAR